MAKADAADRRARLVAGQTALGEPRPRGAVVVDDVGAEVGAEGAFGGTGPPAELAMRLEQAHGRAALGAADGGHEPGQPAAHDSDLVRHM